MMRVTSIFLKNKSRDLSRITKGIKSVLVLDLSECSKDVRRRFAEAVDSLDDAAYTSVIETHDGDDHVRILGKPDGNNMRDLVIISIDNDDCTLVRLEGKIKSKDVKSLIDD